MLDQDNEGGTFGGLEITRRRILFTSSGLNLSTSPVRNSRETRTIGRMANFTFLRGWAKIAQLLVRPPDFLTHSRPTAKASEGRGTKGLRLLPAGSSRVAVSFLGPQRKTFLSNPGEKVRFLRSDLQIRGF